MFGQFLKVDTVEYIEWDEERPLAWSDFEYKGLKAGEKESYALTSVFHSVRGGIKSGMPNFQVRVLYVKEDSWTTNLVSEELLAHEQLHFDLAELYGRKIRKALETLGENGEDQLGEYRKVINLLLDEFKRKSMEYDNETVHGSIAEMQLEWTEYVAFELSRLNKYTYVNINK